MFLYILAPLSLYVSNRRTPDEMGRGEERYCKTTKQNNNKNEDRTSSCVYILHYLLKLVRQTQKTRYLSLKKRNRNLVDYYTNNTRLSPIHFSVHTWFVAHLYLTIYICSTTMVAGHRDFVLLLLFQNPLYFNRL